MEHLYRTIVCGHCFQWIRVPVYCGDRFCDICSPGRRYRIQEKIKYLLKRAVYPPGSFLAMVTVSLHNTPDLAEGIKKLQHSFRRLRQRRCWRQSVFGGVYVIEIKGSPGNWHPHIHAITVQRFFSWRRFRDAWHDITGATGFHVKKVARGQAEKYITKYVVKPDELDLDMNEISDALRGIRLFQPFGTFHGQLGQYVKPKYPCQNCGYYNWMPWDQYIMDFRPRPRKVRPPPRHTISRPISRMCDIMNGSQQFKFMKDKRYIPSLSRSYDPSYEYK